MRWRFSSCSLFAVLLVSHAVHAGEFEDPKDWFKLDTPSFELFSNARESEAKRLLRELESFRYVVSRFLGLTNVQRRPALVYYFKDDASFQPYKPLYQGNPRAVSGFHAEDPLDYVLALSGQAKGPATVRVLFHEYTHLLTARQFRHTPLWAVEGVAEAFSTFTIDDDRYDIGTAVTNHALFLQRNPPIPIQRLLGIGRDSPDYNEQQRAGKFYASSWLLAHYLLFARRGFESDVMARYAALSSATTNRLEAFHAAFGNSPAELDRQLKGFLLGGNYTIVRQTFPELETVRPSRSKWRAGDLDYALGRLLQLSGQLERGRRRLQVAAEGNPSDPRSREALALDAWRSRDREALRSFADDALRLGSTNAFIPFLAAEVRYQQLTLGNVPGIVRAETLAEGRRLCEQALEFDPELAPAHHLLGVYVLAANPRAPGLAETHVRTALRCDPQYQPARLTWASLLAAQGEFVAARRILAEMLAGPLPPELRESVRRVAADVEKRAPRSP